MSCNYICDPDFCQVPFSKLMELNIKEHGIEVDTTSEDHDPDSNVLLTDGKGNYLWAYGESDSNTHAFVRFGMNSVDSIVECLESAFQCSLVDEHDDRYFEIFNEEE